MLIRLQVLVQHLDKCTYHISTYLLPRLSSGNNLIKVAFFWIYLPGTSGNANPGGGKSIWQQSRFGFHHSKTGFGAHFSPKPYLKALTELRRHKRNKDVGEFKASAWAVVDAGRRFSMVRRRCDV